MRFAPLLTVFTLTAGLVGSSAATGQLSTGKAKGKATELAKFDGDWTVVKLVPPPGEQAPPADELKRTAVMVRGDKVTVAVHDPANPDLALSAFYLLKLDPTKSPAQLDLVCADDKHRPLGEVPVEGKGKVPQEVLRGVYKFDGETLVVALPTDVELGRAAGFTPVAPKNPKGSRAEQAGVALVYLTKKK